MVRQQNKQMHGTERKQSRIKDTRFQGKSGLKE